MLLAAVSCCTWGMVKTQILRFRIPSLAAFRLFNFFFKLNPEPLQEYPSQPSFSPFFNLIKKLNIAQERARAHLCTPIQFQKKIEFADPPKASIKKQEQDHKPRCLSPSTPSCSASSRPTWRTFTRRLTAAAWRASRSRPPA